MAFCDPTGEPQEMKEQEVELVGRKLVAANLRRLRHEKRISQEELSERCGHHRTYISQLERCRTNVSVDSLTRLARTLEVQLSEFFRSESLP